MVCEVCVDGMRGVCRCAGVQLEGSMTHHSTQHSYPIQDAVWI